MCFYFDWLYPSTICSLVNHLESPITACLPLNTGDLFFPHLCCSPQLATRLLAHKIQSPQEWEAMQALLVSPRLNPRSTSSFSRNSFVRNTSFQTHGV